MNFNQYQKQAMVSVDYLKEFAIVYPTLGLNGKAGVIAEKIKKLIREKNNPKPVTKVEHSEVVEGLGDVLWYLTALANDLNTTLDHIAQVNLDKLEDRAKRGPLEGDGDDR